MDKGSQEPISALQQVFAIPELLELILRSCRPIDLYTAQRVHPSWQQAISRSLPVRRLLFKQALAGPLSENLAWCFAWGLSHDLVQHDGFFSDTYPSSGHLVRFCPHPLIAAIAKDGDTTSTLDMGSLQLRTGPMTLVINTQGPIFDGVDPAALRTTKEGPASWRDNLVCQPPAKRILMKIWKERSGDLPLSDPDLEAPLNTKEKRYFTTIGHSRGVTLEMVSRAVKSYVWRHQYPGVKYVAVELLLRFD